MSDKRTKTSNLLCLTHEQVQTNIVNMAEIMKLPKPTIVFKGKVKPKPEEVTKYKLRNLKETAEEYELWECEDKFYFIVIYSNKFEEQFFLACDWFNHLFKPFVFEKGIDRPKVYLCYATVINNKMYKQIPQGLLQCPYRLVGIPDVHTLTGSPNKLDSYIISYELLDTKDKAFNGKEYSDILASDPGVKIVNALPGELIRVKMIYSDKGNVFTTYKIRRVKSTHSKLSFHDKSGVDMFE